MNKIALLVGLLLMNVAMAQGSHVALRDPTLPPNVAGQATKKAKNDVQFMLQAVLLNDNRYIAVINNMVVQVGSRIGLYQVKSIQKDSVELEGGEKPLILKLFSPQAIQTSLGEAS